MSTGTPQDERDRSERYEAFDRLVDLSSEGTLSLETAIAIFRDLSPAAVQQALPGTPHLHELDASTGEEWCVDCGDHARRCKGPGET